MPVTIGSPSQLSVGQYSVTGDSQVVVYLLNIHIPELVTLGGFNHGHLSVSAEQSPENFWL